MLIAIKKNYVYGYKITLNNTENKKTKKNNFSNGNNPPRTYGLSILEAMIQVLFKKNMNLVWF